MERVAYYWRLAARALLAALAAAPVASASTLPVSISTTDHGAYEVSVAGSGDDLAVAWYDTRDRHAQIYVRLLVGDAVVGKELQLTRGKRFAYEPSVQLTRDALIVGWYDKLPNGGDLTARLGAWGHSGDARWQVRLSAAGHEGRNPVARLVGDAIFCAWLEGARGASPSVWTRWFDLEGRPLTPAHRAAPAGRTTWNLNAAVDAHGQAWLAFDARMGTRASEVYVVRDTPAAAAVSRVTADDGIDSVYPDIALSGDRIALSWADRRDGNGEIYLFAGMTADLGEQIDRRSRRVTYSDGESMGAYLAWNGRSLGLAWSDNAPGQYEVFFQSFDVAAMPLTDVRRLSDSDPWSLIPAIAAWREGFALAWNEYVPASKSHRTDSRSGVQLLLIDAHP